MADSCGFPHHMLGCNCLEGSPGELKAAVERIARLEAELAYWHEEFHCKDAETARLEVKNIGAEQMVRTILRLDSGGVIGDPQAQDIREKLKRLVTVETELIKEKNRADGHCLSADYLREKCGQLEALASSHFADLTKAWECNITLRKRIHSIEKHNQFFERCESAWCHGSEKYDPASERHGDRFAIEQLAASEKLSADRLELLKATTRDNLYSALRLYRARKQTPDQVKWYADQFAARLEEVCAALAQIRAALPKEE